MSTYSQNYKKVNDGYLKILSIIDSVIDCDQLQNVPVILNSWVNLVDMYCTEVSVDRKDKHRKMNAEKLAYAAKDMYEDMKGFYQFKSEQLSPEYTGVFKNIKVRPLNEYEYE